MPIVFLHYVFDVPLVIQMNDEEKCLWKELSIDETMKLAHENAKDIITFGFDSKKTFIFANPTFMGECPDFYKTVCKM